jgi:UDP-N-acetylmuramoylalanine--D-glutamate ligase
MKRIVVLGGGISGYGSAILAKKEGFDTFLSDSGTIAPLYKSRLAEWEVPFEEGGHTASLILSADEVVKSPGIPDKAPIVKALRAKGIPMISEIEFAGRYTRAKTICITGSNGKTTTTLTFDILKQAGWNVALAGNIGESFAWFVATADYDWYVLELSSFQLDGMRDFRTDIALLMNITPDHLDRYDYRFENYAQSKMGIIRNQGADDSFIYSADDATIAEKLGGRDLGMHELPFSVKKEITGSGAWLTREGIIKISVGRSALEMDSSRLLIGGLHNIYNVMAASMAALAAGVSPKSIERTVMTFAGVEHRLERVAEIGDVEYINDSKGTNVDSVWYALESMTRPVVWIAGGTDKGNDYEPLKELARQKVKTLVAMGTDNRKLVEAFEGVVPQIYSTASMEDAMSKATAAAATGDVVLLSPACASFDLFNNYEHRGRMFKEWVNNNK